MTDFQITTMERRFQASAILGFSLLGLSACGSSGGGQ